MDPLQPEPARLSVAALARRLGVAPATLRTWDRRYGLGPNAHRSGAHRRYGPADVERLEVMRRLTREGVPPGEAARVALARPLTPAPATREAAAQAGGGRVLALPGADAVVRGLGRAAMSLDARAVTDTVREQVQAHGVLHTWDAVLRPVLVAVGRRWAATGEGVEVEHLLSDCTAVALREATTGRQVPADGARPVLLACAPGEWHVLALHALAAGLAERGVGSRTLGASTPAAALAAAVRRTGPAVLFLWSQLPSHGDPAVLATIPVQRPPTALIVGGPGWPVDRLPAGVSRADDLADAVAQVERALGR